MTRIVWVLLIAILLVSVGVGAAVAGLDQADRIASVSSAVIAVIGLVVTAGMSRRSRELPSPDPQPDGPQVPRQLPLAVRHFTDRAEEFGRLDELRREGCGLAVIHGKGGIGKTGLAVTWGHSVRDEFRDGDLFVNLNGYSEHQRLSAEEVLSRFLRALGVPPADLSTDLEVLASHYQTVMHGRQMLVVLDNVHPETPLSHLLPGSPTCMTIITSRDRLRHAIVDHGAEPIPLHPLPETDAVLLVERLAARPELDQATASVIAGRCSNRPLYLRLAAQRVNELGPDHVEALFSEIEEEERSVESLSYRSLDPEAARLLRLAALPDLDDLSPPAAAALCGIPLPDARRLLARLSGAALLEESAAGRYRFHDVIKEFAEDMALTEDSADERLNAFTRLLEFYAGTAEDADHAVFPHDPTSTARRQGTFATSADALAWCETERINLLAVSRQAMDLGLNEQVWRIAFSLIYFFRRFGYFQNWLDALKVARAAAARAGDAAAQAKANRAMGGASYFSRRYEEAVTYYNEALELWRQIRNSRGEGVELSNMAGALFAMNRFEEARDYGGRSLALLREHGAERDVSIVLRIVGEVDLAEGDVHAAGARLDEALAAARRAADCLEEGYALHALAALAASQDRLSEAESLYGEAIGVRRTCSDRVGLAESLAAIGLLLAADDDWQRAEPYLTEALAIFEEIDDLSAAAPVRAALGARSADQGS